MKIPNKSDRDRYWICTFSMACFSLCAGTFPTFLGYDLESRLGRYSFLWEFLMFALLLHFCLGLIKQEKKYHVFRKKWHPYIFSAGYLILSLSFAIVACFTTKSFISSSGLHKTKINPIYYFSIFLPLFFTYLIFCYYSFMKTFAKLGNEEKHHQEDMEIR